MRSTIAIAAVLLLVGAGCAPEMDRDDVRPADTTPVTTASTTETAPVVSTTPAATTTPTVKTDDRKDADDAEDKDDDKDDVKTTPTVTPTQPAATGYTMAEVKAQVAAGKCWSVIGGKVYDLSDWINKHPGGAGAIKSLCGIDGTAKFQAVHGGQGKPEAVLAKYLLGALK